MVERVSGLDASLVHLRDAELFRSVLPSKIFESLAMQRPILLGVRGQAEELLDAIGGGLSFAPEDAAGLVDAAAQLMARPDRGTDLGVTGRERVLARFELDSLANRYIELLENTRRQPLPPSLRASGVSQTRA